MNRLEAYFWNIHRAFTLPLSHEPIIPGAVLETRWRPTWPLPWLIDTNPEFRVHARLEVSDVRVRLFKRGFAGHDFRWKPRALKENNDARYADVDNNFLVDESFYLKGLRWQFSTEGAVHFNAEVEKLGVNVSAQTDVEWKSATALRFSGCSTVPVAVRGMKIRSIRRPHHC